MHRGQKHKSCLPVHTISEAELLLGTSYQSCLLHLSSVCDCCPIENKADNTPQHACTARVAWHLTFHTV